MVSYMQANYNVDPTRIFITGLSAGACMTNIMLACYPDIFSKGASMSGAPYLSATSATQANNVMLGLVTNTSTNWASLVTGAYPSYSGSYPSIAIFHGSYDNVVSIVNENEMMKQWTAVHQLSQTPPQVENAFNGNVLVTQNRYFSSQDIPLVETYTISGMGHGIALDTGNCWGQCGKAGLYALDVYFNSTYWAAQFFGIISNSITISGPLTLASNSNGVTYSVSAIPGANYTWTVPQGYVITGGQGTFQIMINSGSQSGFISVRAVLGTGCSINSNDLFVTVSTANHIEPKSEIPLIVKQTASNTIIICSSEKRIVPIKIYNTLGNLCFASEVETNSEIRIPENISEGIYLIVLSNYAQKIWLNQ